VSQAVVAPRSGTPLNRSIERAARLLGLFTPERPELSLSELTGLMQTSKASTHRYALALRRAGLLRYDAAQQLYTLGPRVVELAASALAGLRIIQIAGPHMQRLVARANETVVLSVWDGESPVVVRVEDTTDRIVRIVVRTGTRLPAASAQGKVFAAFASDAEPARRGQAEAGGNGSSRNGLSEAELADVRSRRIAVNSQVVEGIRAIATPVFQNTELVAAMALVGTTASIPEDPESALGAMLRDAAGVLSAELGFLPIDDATHPTERSTP
jgi:DNA-binding IclR family transcriptional regulator